MDFQFTGEQERFREEVRGFLEAEIKSGTFKPMCDGWIQGFSPEFTSKVAARGWIGLSWPAKFGGQGRSNVDRFILTEEMLRYGAPTALHWFADRQIGRALMHFGNEEQQKEYLPRILRGEAYVGLGLSEPQAGSDLGSVQTKVTEEGDSYVFNGQKMWTSCARYMNYIYMVARTDPNAPKHRGVSEFILPVLNVPGITIVPTIDITGTEAWGEVFFDNVKVSKNTLIGEKNRGFYQVVNQLDYERSGLERLMGNYPLFDAIVKFAKETRRHGVPVSQDPLVRDKLSRLQVEFEVGRLLTYRVALTIDAGKTPTTEAAMAKMFCTAFEQHLADLSTRILGLYGQLMGESKWAPISGMAPHSFLGSMGYSLQAGTSEILRNVIATRGLGLPDA
jgi:3-oxocholest-4-en-26-oyl-CoA dehydrogenase alpha subunit